MWKACIGDVQAAIHANLSGMDFNVVVSSDLIYWRRSSFIGLVGTSGITKSLRYVVWNAVEAILSRIKLIPLKSVGVS